MNKAVPIPVCVMDVTKDGRERCVNVEVTVRLLGTVD